MRDWEYRYFVLAVAENGGMEEIARTKTRDVADLLAKAVRKDFCKQFPTLSIEIEDKYQAHTFPEMMEAVAADGT